MVVWGCARFVRVGQRTAVQSGTVPYSTRPGRGGGISRLCSARGMCTAVR